MTQIVETIEDLDEKIISSRTRRNQLDDQAKLLAQKRDELNEQFQELKAKIQELKEKRDNLNARVRELKEKREEARKRLQAKRNEAESVKETILTLEKKVTGSYSNLKKKMQELEWKIQTNSLSAKEEARLIVQIKDLESKLVIHDKIRELGDKVIMLQAEINAARLAANEAHEKLSELAKESEVYHERMIEVVKQASELKSKADEAHLNYARVRQQADEAHQEYIKAKELRQKIIMEDQATRLRKQQEVRRKVENMAEEKLKKGEKLSLDEFRALVEKGAV
jgi:uncharacterized coiled-coil DUF342 family protein